MSSQWNGDLRAFPEPSAFGYNPYMLSSANVPMPIDSGAARNTMAPTPAAAAPAQTALSTNTRRYFDAGTAERHRHAIAVSVSPPTNGPSESSRQYDLSSRAAQENRRQGKLPLL